MTTVALTPAAVTLAAPTLEVVPVSGIRAAREALGAALTAAVTYSVLDHEPKPGGLTKPTYITLGAAGVTPTEYQFAVRCYSDTSRGSLDVALDRLDDMITAVEDGLPVAVPRGNWTLAWDEAQNAYVGTLIAEYPRSDF
jgi:hypothetical protein